MRPYLYRLLLLPWLLLAAWGARAQAPTWQSAMGVSANGASSIGGNVGAVATNAAGDVFITGSYTGTATFGGTTLTSSSGSEDVYVAKWNTSAGTWAWAVSSTGDGSEIGFAIAVSGNNVYVGGAFFSTSGNAATISGSALTCATTDGSTDAFIAKYYDNGTTVASKGAFRGGGAGNDRFYGLAVNASNSTVYAGGTVGATGTVSGTTLTTPGGTDLLLARYTDTGMNANTSLVEGGAIRAGGTGADRGFGLTINAAGSLYLVGNIGSAGATIGGSALTSAGGNDVVVAKATDTGGTLAFTAAARAGGSGSDIGFGIASSGTSVYVTGQYISTTATFGSTTLTNADNTGNTTDAFVACFVDGGSTLTATSALNIGSTGTDVGRGIAVSGGVVYATGNFSGTVTIGSTSLTAAGSQDVYAAKYTDTSGTLAANGGLKGGGTGTGTATGIGVGSGTDCGAAVTIAANNSQAVVVGSIDNTTATTFGGTTLGAGPGGFIAKLTGLVAAPTVTTATPTTITGTSAVLGGSVTADGGATVTDRGVVYSVNSTNATPTIGGTGVTTNPNSTAGTGAFSEPSTGLAPGTTYAVRAYATNSAGTSYGSALTFTTLALPAVNALAPTNGPVGTTVVITGTGFGLGTTAVSFNGTAAASFTVNSNTQITATVASGTTTGNVVVTTSGGSSNAAAANVFTVTVPTTVTSITTSTSSPTNAGSISYTVTFANSVTGVTVSNFSLSPTVTGASVSSVSGSGTTYTVVVSTGSGDGTLQLNLANSTGLSPSVSNVPFASPAITIDKTRPSVTISSTAGGNNGTTATTPIPFTVTFSEAVTGFVQGDLVVAGGTISGFSGSGATYTFNVTPSGSGSTVTVNIAANQAQDAAGNSNTAASQFSITYQQPLVANAQAVTVQLDTNGNGTLNASSVNNNSTGAGTLAYTIQKITFGYIPESTTPLTLTTPNGANFTQIRFASYGTPSNSSSGNYSLGSCSAANSLAAAQNAYVGRSSGSLYASNTDTRNNPVLGDPCSGTPKALAVQAAYSADAASLAYDCTEAGKTQYVLLTVTNGTSTSTSVAQVTVNPSPTATISSVSPTTAQRGATVTVTGTNLSGVNGVTVNGATATVSGLSASGFTFTVPTSATIGTGTLTVTAPCGQTLTSTFTVQAPTITVAPATLPNGATNTAYSQSITASGGTAPYNYAITSGALPAGLTLASNGTLSGTPTVAGTFTFTVTATDASTGSGPYSGSRSYTLTIITSTTTVTSVTRLTPSPTATAQVRYQVVFSSSVSGVTVSNFTTTTTGSVTLSGTGVSSTSGSGTTYIVTVNTGTGDGTLRLDVANTTGVSPTISNVPYTAGETYTITKSFAAAPTLRIQAAGSASGNSDVTAFVDVVQVLQSGTSTVVANGLQNGSFETNNVSAGSYLYQNQGVVAAPWTFTSNAGVSRNNSAFGSTAADGDAVAFLQSVASGNGNVTQNLAVPTGSYQVRFRAIQRNYTSLDQRLNVFVNDVFVGNIQPNNIPTYDTFTSTAFSVTAPALTAIVSTTSASPTSTAPIPFSVSFSDGTNPQSVGSTFTASDVTVAGGTVTSGSFSGSGAGPYTFTVTPSGTGTVTVSLVANVANDANNTGNSASNTVSVQYSQPQTAAPVVTVPANGSFVSTATPTYAGTAPASSTITVYVDNSVIGTTTANASGNWSFSQPVALSQGTHSVYATAQLNGQTVSNNSNANTFTVDSQRPSVAIGSSAGASGSTTSTSPIPYTVTFSEAVTGFVAGDVTVTNGTITGGVVNGAGTTYTFTVTPTTPGTATTVNVPANVAQDQAGNGNTAAASAYSLTFQAPTIVVAPASLPQGTQGTAYSQTLTASGGTAPYTFAITAGALPTGLTLNSAGVLSGTPMVNGTYTFTVTATDASATPGPYSGSRSYSLTIAAPTITATTWTGTISTDWFTAGNWTQGVPTATIDATIPTAPSGGRFPAFSAGTANVRNLTFNSGATLNQSGGTLVIAANLTNNGTYQPTGGTVSLGNTALGVVLGSGTVRFWNLTIGANGALLATSAGASVQRLLTLNGSFSTNGNPFTLESNANLTAMVVNNGSNVINGNVTVQRYIDPSLNPNLGYRHVSAAVSNATVGSLTTSGFSPVVTPAYNASATPLLTTPFPTVYGYDQSRLATTNNNLNAFDKGWYSPSSTADALTVGQGYTVLIGGGQTWNFTGPLNNGTQTVNVANSGPAAATNGYNLIGNPYPAPLDWSQVAAADRPNVGSALYVYRSNDPANPYAGVYGVYSNGVGNISPVIAQGQGFFVQVPAGQTTGSVTFRNAQRATSYANPTYQRTAENRPLVEMNLQGAGSSLTDAAFVYFEQGATDNFDAQYDAEKLPNPSGLNLSTSLNATKRLAIDGRGPLGSTQRVVPLAVGVPAVGSYTLNAAQLLNLGTTPVYLRDLQTGAVVDLNAQPSYSFTVSNASALMTGRFELVFAPQGVLATAPAALAAQVGLYPNPATTTAFVELPAALGRTAVAAELVDALGRTVRTVSLPAQGAAPHRLSLTDLATGVYTLHLKTSVGVIVKKLVID
jgi:hypothetical protein